MRVEITADPVRVERLVPDWRRLAAECPLATPFNHPGWVLAWWRERRAEGLRWRFATAWDTAETGRLAGVLPLIRCPDGVIRYAGHDLHDVAAALAGPAALAPLWRGAGAWLRAEGSAPVLELPVIADEDRAVLPAAGLVETAAVPDPSAAIALPSTWDAYLASLPSGRRKRLRWERRRLERDHGPVAVAFAVPRGTRAQLDELWLMRERSWRGRGRYEELVPQARGDRFRTFLHAAARAGQPDGIVEVASLHAGGRTMAMALLLCHGDRIWYYTGTYDLAQAGYGPGRMLLLACVHEAIRRRAGLLDLGRGDEPYKFAVGATRRVLHNVTVSV